MSSGLEAVRRHLGFARPALLVWLVAWGAGTAPHLLAQQEALVLLPTVAPEPEPCGTNVERARELGFRPLTAAIDGNPVSFEQSPAILSPDYSGTIALRRFVVAGDVPAIRIKLATAAAEIQTWPRTRTDTLAGRQVSVFEPSWPSSTLAAVLRGRVWGFDYPGLYWGEVLPVDETAQGHAITLRMASGSLPAVHVTRLADDVQYSSHVVNIVLPEFGSRFIADDHAFEFTAVTNRFYQHFADTYDSIAVVPQDIFLSDYGAFHRNVRNDVDGINLRVFNTSAAYGSRSERLRSLELFNRVSFATNISSAHEIAHQWGAYIDWPRLSGLARAGHQPDGHDPLWAEGETFIGSVLTAVRRVRRGGQGWEIENTPAPQKFHPYTLYAMGLIGPEQVPEITLFDDQGQFDPESVSSPEPGRAVVGGTRTATVYNVIGMHGPRVGPVHREWHRATVVVSRERPLTQREMDYWTFFAQRVSDPNGRGLPAYLGTGSFDEATSRRMDLRTEIVPLNGAPLVEPLPVEFPALGRRDFRDVVFDEPVATRYRAGDRITLSGVVSAPDRSDINIILVRLWKAFGTVDNQVWLQGPVSSASSFVLSGTLEDRHRGVHMMEVFLFWPGSGSQSSRVSITPITIE